MRSCSRCILHRYRKNAVPGEGSRNASVMLIGEAPGATEDELGRPFVGAAGRLLTMVLESLGIRREQTYITNVVKCRPPQNREPRDDEIENCSIYLESQIVMLKPKIVVTLGNIAGKKVFSMCSIEWEGIMRMRGRVYSVNLLGLDVSVIPTIHPAAALYNPSLREILTSDLKYIRDLMYGSIGKESNKRDTKTLLDYIKKRHLDYVESGI
uniref:Type-4 uracil-DNA glycosylase n=1 Tax=Ignisphaera aggregans TaxID=334771 RepID=A0A7C4H2I3_9CREN